MGASENNIGGLARVNERNPAFTALISVPVDVRAQQVTMHVLSDEKVEQLTAAGSPLPLAMFTLTAGVAAAIVISIYSGGIVASLQATFWIAFWAMLILTIFFGGSALYESRKTKRIKQAIKEQSKTVVTLPTVEVQSQNPLS